MENLWKGIAIAGIWIGVSISAFAPGMDGGAVAAVALFAMIATMFVS